MIIDIEKVNVKEGRFREDFGDIEELAESIEKYGIIHPPVVDEDFNIIAGERRIRAMQYLGYKEIPVRQMSDLNELELREIELEENIRRKQFSWTEEVKAKREIDEIKREIHGSKVKGHETDGWGVTDTAKELDQSVGTVSQDIKLAKALDEYPELAEEKNKHRAMKKLKKLEEEKTYQEMLKLMEDKELSDRFELHNEDCIEWLKERESGSVDLIVMDPPWGIDMDTASQTAKKSGVEYVDDIDEILFTVDKAIEEAYRVLKDDAHLYCFFGIRHYQLFKDIILENGFEIDEVPLVWTKGQAGAPAKYRTYPSSYETIFFAYKGKRDLNSGDNNHFDYKRPKNSDRIHSAQKPIALLRNLIENSSEPGDIVVDPFMGSGATVAAAILSDRYGIGIEMNETCYVKASEFVKEKTKDKRLEDAIEEVKGGE